MINIAQANHARFWPIPFHFGKKTEIRGQRLIIHLSQPDPNFPRNASLLRFFRVQGVSGACPPLPSDAKLIGSGDYKTNSRYITQLHPETELVLLPTRKDLSALKLLFVTDESSRTLLLLRGTAEVAYNALPIHTTAWIYQKYSKKFNFSQREGVNVAYLGFNLRDPILKNKNIRLAIAHAVDRNHYVNYRMFGFGSVAGGFLSPHLTESLSIPFDYNLQTSRSLMDLAGYPKKSDGTRLTLKYKTTTSKFGMEKALVIKNMLKKIGVRVVIEVVEPAVYFSSLNSGNFQLFSSRWVGVSDPSIYFLALHSSQKKNRVRYNNQKMDLLLIKAAGTLSGQGRRDLFNKIQRMMMRDLPYFPLWFWKNVLITNQSIRPVQSQNLSLSGSLEPLTKLRRVSRSHL